MNQEQLARQLNGVVYAQRKLSYHQKKLDALLAHDPLMLAPTQRTLSVAHVQVAAQHEGLIKDATKEVAQAERAMQRLAEALLAQIPDVIRQLIRQGMPLVAQWQPAGIRPLALVFEQEAFTITRYSEVAVGRKPKSVNYPGTSSSPAKYRAGHAGVALPGAIWLRVRE